jgi:hypothetical protein
VLQGREQELQQQIAQLQQVSADAQARLLATHGALAQVRAWIKQLTPQAAS